MVEELKFQLRNPFFIAALILVILIYSRIIPLRQNSFKCMVNDPYCIEGVICSNPSKTSSGKYYIVQIDSSRATGTVNGNRSVPQTVTASSCGKASLLVPCNIIEALYPGKLYSLSKNQVITKGDRNCILFEKQEKALFYGKESSSGYFIVERVQSVPQKETFLYEIYRKRAGLRLGFKRLMYAWGNAGALILSLLSGSREYLDCDVGLNFRKAGLSHILALSGMHLSFFSGLSGRVSTVAAGKKLSFYFKLASILLFVLFAGLSPSLLRALICALVVLFCNGLSLKNVSQLSVLCFAFILHAVLRCEDLFNAGFLLSYGALAGILLFSNDLTVFFNRFMPSAVSGSFSASIGAQSVTFPISVSLFGEVMPIGIIASVFVSPIVSAFMAAAVLSICICLVLPFLSPVFSYIMNLVYSIIVFTVRLFASVPSIKF